MEWIIEFVWLKTFNPTNEINSIPFQFQQHSNNPGNKYYNIWIMADFTTCILTLACLYIIYANQQITLIFNFYSIVVLLFLNFFSINDIYLLSFFIGLIYSGALVISFLFVLMIIDLNVFNLRNNLIFIWFGFFMNQQCYNSFSFLMIHFSLTFLFNLRKIKQYYKDIMYELFFIFNLNNSFILSLIDLLLVYFLYFQWWSFLSIPLND